MVTTELLLAGASAYLAYLLLQVADMADVGSLAPPSLVQLTLFAVFVAGGIGAMGLYSIQQRHRAEGVLARVILGVGIAALAFIVFLFLLGDEPLRELWILAFVLAVMLVGAVRIAFSKHWDSELFRRRVLVYGAGNRASRILELRRRSDQRGFRIVGFVAAPGDRLLIDDERVLRRGVERLCRYAIEHGVDEIVIAADDRRRQFPSRELLRCKLSGIGVIDLMEFLERETGRVKVDIVHPSWLILQDGFSRLNGKELGFRALDLLVLVVLLPCVMPVIAVIAIAIYVDDGLPLLYRQTRVGKGGKTFTLYKFRSMRRDAERGHPVWAQAEDHRVTRVGRYLRMCRVDELPQLLNVLKNDMSFVGPRPERPEFVEELECEIPYYQERHCVKPGLTGWAQLSYPYGASHEDALAKLEYDMYYVKNRSLIFNLVILLQTAEVVLWQKGAR